MDQNCKKVLLILTDLGIQTYICSTLLNSVFLNQSVHLDSFKFEADCWFLIILKYDLYIGIGMLICQKW